MCNLHAHFYSCCYLPVESKAFHVEITVFNLINSDSEYWIVPMKSIEYPEAGLIFRAFPESAREASEFAPGFCCFAVVIVIHDWLTVTTAKYEFTQFC